MTALLQPLQDDGGVQPAGIGEDDAGGGLGHGVWAGRGREGWGQDVQRTPLPFREGLGVVRASRRRAPRRSAEARLRRRHPPLTPPWKGGEKILASPANRVTPSHDNRRHPHAHPASPSSPPPALALPATARADEGMWTFDAFPTAKMKADYGWAPDQAWLDRVQAAAVRLTGGCSASFVSPTGLILTNHHCVVGCLQNLSTGDDNLVANGINTPSLAEERKCPGQQAEVVTKITDVTSTVNGAIGQATRSGAGERARRRHRPAGVGPATAPTPKPSAVRSSRSSAAGSTSSTNTANTPTCAWSGHRSSRRRSSAATRTISTSRATPSIARSCAPMRTASRSPRRST